MKMFSVYDSKAGSYYKPFFSKNTIDALRSWEQICKDDEAPFKKYPSDFALYELGEWDEITGELKQHNKPVHLSNVVRPLTPTEVIAGGSH